MPIDEMLRILKALQSHDVAYKLVGGAAMAMQGLARATEDMDIFVDATDENIERLRSALRSVFDDPHIDEIKASDLRGDYPAIQYIPPGANYHLDLLARLGDALDYAGIEAETKTVQGLRVTVATPRMLHEMKRDTVRLRDKADAQRLADAFDLGG